MPYPSESEATTPLEDGSTVAVVGGGPSGAFFALHFLQQAKRLGRTFRVVIIEKKRELHFYEPSQVACFREGCNYCAGGISPRMTDALREIGIELPSHILQGEANLVTVHSEWTNIELPIPEGRSMLSVFRGSRPKDRPERHINFDSAILQKAAEEGAQIATGEVTHIGYSSERRPVLTYRRLEGEADVDERLEADFTVFAGGVNQTSGREFRAAPIVQSLRRALPGFEPPRVRKALICELHIDQELLASMSGEVHFAEYGSRRLRIEMSSLIPKEAWLTVVLLGKSIDVASPGDHMAIVKAFLDLPHIRRILPPKARPQPVCICNPSMTIGTARQPYGHRVALTGDIAVTRLYKDGIYSAYVTSKALADCALYTGVDRQSLRKTYWPAVRRISRDNRYGQVVFLLNRLTFNNPVMSRVVYQAVSTERRTRPEPRRRLTNILWRIASGDDSYQSILSAMLHPASLAFIAGGGLFVTLRNYLTELAFGLRWGQQARHSTSMHKEEFEAKRRQLNHVAGLADPAGTRDFESMYSIVIKAERDRIFDQLWKFGGDDMDYFRPHLIHVRRVQGAGREVGTRIQYDLPVPFLRFSIALEKIVPGHYLVYKVQDGFGKDGVLVFAVERVKAASFRLYIYVTFDFPRGGTLADRCFWRFFKTIFPGFVHDVLWNYALCQLKDLAEQA